MAYKRVRGLTSERSLISKNFFPRTQHPLPGVRFDKAYGITNIKLGFGRTLETVYVVRYSFRHLPPPPPPWPRTKNTSYLDLSVFSHWETIKVLRWIAGQIFMLSKSGTPVTPKVRSAQGWEESRHQSKQRCLKEVLPSSHSCNTVY